MTKDFDPARSNRLLFSIAGGCALLALVTVITVGFLFFSQDDTPGDNSVDAGFARDMSEHHAQGVEMAGIVYRRTQDPAIRLLAYDILTTQQAQIGMMNGWLSLWNLPSTRDQLPMAWMGHGMEGPMPGMATDEEVASLETLAPAEMDRTFLRLMIAHHKGALDMAAYAAENAGESLVRTIARAMATSQSGEIKTMEAMLTERGG